MRKSENIGVAEKLVELLLPLTKISQRSLMEFVFLKAALLRKQGIYDVVSISSHKGSPKSAKINFKAYSIYKALFKKLSKIGSVAMYYRIECNICISETHLVS